MGEYYSELRDRLAGTLLAKQGEVNDLKTRNDYVAAVLGAYQRADLFDDLWWRVDDGRVSFSAMCSDLFVWASADSEPIDLQDVPLLECCLADLQAVDATEHLAALFAARKRDMRPMRKWLERHAGAARDLFEAAGPERTPGSEG